MVARQQAIDAYLAYRRDGGEPQTLGGRLCEMVTAAIQHGATAAADQELGEHEEANDPPSFTALMVKLRAILNGDYSEPT
jgi:hypothetical protein